MDAALQNLTPQEYQTHYLPTIVAKAKEYDARHFWRRPTTDNPIATGGGRCRDRTYDLSRVKRTLSRFAERWWAL